MHKSLRTWIVGAVVLSAILCSAIQARPLEGSREKLNTAVVLFDEGLYESAKALLDAVNPMELDETGQKQLTSYQEKTATALRLSEEARRNLADADLALADQDSAQAVRLLESVLDNPYASNAVKTHASAKLGDLKKVTLVAQVQPGDAVEPAPGHQENPVDTEKAKSLTEQGRAAMMAGRYDEAERLFNDALGAVPGYPEAVNGLTELAQYRANAAGATGQSLTDVLRQEDRVNWQRTVATYRELEREIRGLMDQNQYEEARRVLARANSIVESGKQFASPLSEYHSLRAEASALENELNERDRRFNEAEAERVRQGVEETYQRTVIELTKERQKRVDALIRQAREHRKDEDLQSALQVMDQVLEIDPQNELARVLHEEWQEYWTYQRQRKIQRDINTQSQEALMSVREALTPWVQELRYPQNWPEIISRPERNKAGAGPLDAVLLGQLDNTMAPVDFKKTPFQEVIERFASNHNINLHVKWSDVQAAGVDPMQPISLSLPQEITLRKALELVLEEAGGQVDLGYAVRDGVVSVATQSWIDANDVHARTYDINDLLHEIPDFVEGPKVGVMRSELRLANDADLDAVKPWKSAAPDAGDVPVKDSDRDDRVGKIIRLIMDTIDPDSWTDRGGGIGVIREINGQLVVTQNSATQEQVAGLLNKLREQRMIQIAVEARFITVQNNFLEEMGIDIDLVLNGGNAGFDLVRNGDGLIASDPVYGNRLMLPREFSRMGFLPSTPAGVGTPFTNRGTTNPENPSVNPAFIPPADGGPIGFSNATPVPVRSNVLDFTNPSGLASAIPGSFAGRTTPAMQIFGSFLDNIQVDFLIRATQADSRTALLTAPKLVLTNGQAANVAVVTGHAFVSQLQPVVAGGAAAQAPQTNVVNEGAVLSLRGTVSADRRYVTMTLLPGVARLVSLQQFQFAGQNVETGAGFVQLPIVESQTVQTTVSVPDGGTLLVGGQKLSAEIEVDAGVPILSKIPILKRFYSSRSMVKDEQILLILIKPQIIIPTEQEKLAFPTLSSR